MPKAFKNLSQNDLEEGELPLLERVAIAHANWLNAEGTLSIRKAARQCGIPKSTLEDRIHKKTTKAEEGQKRQRLTPEEEESLATWILRL
ncbi:hypothetical protein ABVK25_012559 [Lepraria finkii]|uniref:HTH psq-type domain-containing protein n=1 Tax=Lepraria finkii TaxID=1340010 RepID=A0ABR4AGG0_9LECA